MSNGGAKNFVPVPYKKIEEVMQEFRTQIENAVAHRTQNGKVGVNGAATLTSLIRSQALIKVVHTHVANRFHHEACVPEDRIYFECTLPTPFDGKREDVALFPRGCALVPNEEVVAIGVRSQIQSVGKNLKNNFSATRNDATDFHETYPAQVVAHVQVLALSEVNTKKAAYNVLKWDKSPNIARTISWYGKISGRKSETDAPQHTERVGLIIVDLEPETPILYWTLDALKQDKWITDEECRHHKLDLAKLLYDNTFTQDVLRVHASRFPGSPLRNCHDVAAGLGHQCYT